jgi:hypothetical protein
MAECEAVINVVLLTLIVLLVAAIILLKYFVYR